jgi:hypothetical protein
MLDNHHQVQILYPGYPCTAVSDDKKTGFEMTSPAVTEEVNFGDGDVGTDEVVVQLEVPADGGQASTL